MKNNGKLILTAQGLTSNIGRRIIGKELIKENLESKKIVFFHEPYNLSEPILIEACLELGFRKDNLYFSGEELTTEIIEGMDYIYVTEGNTFKVLKLIQKRGFLDVIADTVRKGATYIGTSAGASIAGNNISLITDIEENVEELCDLRSLGLVDGGIIPHYTREQYDKYISYKTRQIISSYNHIYMIPDGKILIL